MIHAKSQSSQLVVIGQYINREQSQLSTVIHDTIQGSKSIETAYIREATDGRRASSSEKRNEAATLATNTDES